MTARRDSKVAEIRKEGGKKRGGKGGQWGYNLAVMKGKTPMVSLIHSFPQQVFTEHLLCARHCARPWEQECEPSKSSKDFCQ